jgi:hypothetical protein
MPVASKLSTRSLFLGLAVLACLVAFLPADDAGKKVKVSLVTVLATTRDEPVDPRLTCVAREIRKKNPELKGFQLVHMACASLAPGAKAKFQLVEGQEALVVVERGADKDNKVQLQVRAPLQGEVVYVTVCGKFLPLVTRYKTKKDDLLILCVMVRPCHKK